MKIGIVTITNNGCNYGNQLQNYAVKKIYEKMGCDVKTLYNIDGAEYQVSLSHRIKNYLYIILKHATSFEREREEKFRAFGNKYLNYTRPFRYKNIRSVLKEKFDYISVGSDQVWNPYFKCNEIHIDYLLLSFVKPEKRIALSASMGVSELPKSLEKRYQEELCKYSGISVRENTAQSYLERILEKKVNLIIDPTLMLSREEWNRVSVKPKRYNNKEKYILTYFLGEKSKFVEKDLRYFMDLGFRVFNFCDINDKDMFVNGPSEFVYMISHASCVLTDSFHASVFSFIYGIPFYVYDRNDAEENMSSRFETLFDLFDLHNHYRKNVNEVDIQECNYEKGYMQLEKEKAKVIEFLENIINRKS